MFLSTLLRSAPPELDYLTVWAIAILIALGAYLFGPSARRW